uniref:Tubulin--tyrosine ligase-like protein 12 SET-like domain-containing protein n=1 Tax=Trypanosoma congolense (strain IL3000) TaxID=1068625 RepID=G0UZL4_TRYCI|nr:conserved hypothetical protein [Trypanosoma congolense IL3000]
MDYQRFSTLLIEWFNMHHVPEHLRRRLFEKLMGDVFDAGAFFSLAAVEEEEGEEVDEEEEDTQSPTTAAGYVLVANSDLKAKEDIWLVDHCCTFRRREVRSHLEADKSLRQRLSRILSVELPGESPQQDAQLIFDRVWSKADSYRLPTAEDGGDQQYENSWFIHDEVGSAIKPVIGQPANMKLEPVPLCLPSKGGVFSAMWCVEDMEAGDIATRRATSSLEPVGGMEVLSLLYGTGSRQGDEDCQSKAKGLCVKAWRRHVASLEEAFRTRTEAPHCEHHCVGKRGVTGPLRVFTDSEQVSQHLTDAQHFILVDSPQEAQVVWIAHQSIEESNGYVEALFISQFPEEKDFTSKRGFLRLIQEKCGHVDWYQVSYDTATQLQPFIGDFVVREALLNNNSGNEKVATCEDISCLRHNDGTNLWLSKPANLARSIDMTLSANLTELLKAAETGPKVICKYISNCATLRKRKFDLRFIVAVVSFPTESTALEAYVYNVFWTRFALEDYSLDGFDCYEKHWTVMNYTNPDRLLQLHDRDFISEFNAECASLGYGEAVWETVAYPKILKMLRDAFSTVACGGAEQSRYRAMYGVDVMLRTVNSPEAEDKTLEPSLLEITFSPDCHRACRYHPSFFNDIFHTLFLGNPTNVTRL